MEEGWTSIPESIKKKKQKKKKNTEKISKPFLDIILLFLSF